MRIYLHTKPLDRRAVARRSAGAKREFSMTVKWLMTAFAAAIVAAGAIGNVCGATQSELLVSGAISLRESLQQIGALFERGHPQAKVVFNFGASGVLQQQIERGAPVDVFVSAAPKQMDNLQAKGLILDDTRRTLTANQVVLIKPSNFRFDLASFKDLMRSEVKRIAIGNPRTVPAGEYAREVLTSLKLWDALEPKLILTENVRQALVYVIRGEVEAGLVYATDAQGAGREVQVVAHAPQGSHRPVIYPIAVVTASKVPALARAFVDLALSDEGQEVLRAHGFRSATKGAAR
ncbi:MAG: Molybdenum transporter, periplasmic molybdate-binding protein [candidate division NC10 bacterium]|nr:Molybdenum transporter, periplasmic molybdate-binding protein [candidate division NC10 bacterium]